MFKFKYIGLMNKRGQKNNFFKKKVFNFTNFQCIHGMGNFFQCVHGRGIFDKNMQMENI